MKRLSKDKRNQLILVIIATVGILAAIGFGLIRSQYDALAKIARDKVAAENRPQSIQAAIKTTTAVTNELGKVTATLAQSEEDMAGGDLYSWTYDTIRHFKQQYKVEIPDIGHPTVGTVDLLPNFPYRQVQFTINGTAYYHDLGKFIAAFENDYPHFRMVHLSIEPSSGADGSTEKLSFKMDIIALVKSNPS